MLNVFILGLQVEFFFQSAQSSSDPYVRACLLALQQELGSSLIPFARSRRAKGARGHFDLNLTERIERNPLCLVDFFVGLMLEETGCLLQQKNGSLFRSKKPTPSSAMLAVEFIRFWREIKYPNEE